MKPKNIILASSSPRRRELLSKVGLSFRVITPNINEKRKPRETAAKMVVRVAEDKARRIADDLDLRFGGATVIAADTTVVAPDGKTVMGKPKNRRQARSMLKQLSGKTHVVLTGYCILQVSKGGKVKKRTRMIRTRVTLRKLSESDIRAYLKTGESMDKAGAYAAQGFGMALVQEIRGSYSNVVGLPVSHLLQDLEKQFGFELFHGHRSVH